MASISSCDQMRRATNSQSMGQRYKSTVGTDVGFVTESMRLAGPIRSVSVPLPIAELVADISACMQAVEKLDATVQ